MTHHHRFELVELRLRRLAAAQLQSALEIGDDWIERAVHMIRRALKSQDGRAISFQSRAEFGQDAALADTWLARNQYDLTLALLCQMPAVQQQAELVLSPHERRQPTGADRVEASF